MGNDINLDLQEGSENGQSNNDKYGKEQSTRKEKRRRMARVVAHLVFKRKKDAIAACAVLDGLKMHGQNICARRMNAMAMTEK